MPDIARTIVYGLAAATLAFLARTGVFADEWPGPQVITEFSESGEYFLRIYPGKSLGETFGFAGAPRGLHAKAEFYARQSDRSYRLIWERELLNPVAPVDVLVSNKGYVITLDNWHNMGYGKIVALYTPQGALIRSYELTDLYTKDQLSRISGSVSSRHWRGRTRGLFGLVDPSEQTKVYVMDSFRNTFVFDLRTGKYSYDLNPANRAVPKKSLQGAPPGASPARRP